MSRGRLVGVGVGPGAPDLLTLRAVRVLREADVLCVPRASAWSPSTAWRVVEPHVGDGAARRRFLTFPMSTDPERVRPAVEAALDAVGEHLAAGREVAFLTEGDPLLYSTFVYVLEGVRERWPQVPVEIVPGVTSVTAVAAAAGAPLSDGRERIAVIPALYGVDDLERLLDQFDTVVLMKIGPEMPRVVEALERKGLLGRAVYVSRATMPEERIVRRLDEVRETRGDCFAMVLVTRRQRSGALLGREATA